MSSKQILVVDDNEHNRQFVRAHLESTGFGVREASGGAEALEIFDEEQIDLVLLDIMMPGMNGYEVCQRLRDLPGGRDIGVVFLTALDDSAASDRAREAGGDDFLTKPVNRQELIMRVGSLMWIKELRDELDEGYELFREQRDNLLAYQRQKDELMHFLVHDLKNLLTSQISNADFLRRQTESQAHLGEAAEDILLAARTMERMVEDMLDIGQSEAGRLVVRKKPVDLSRVLRFVCEKHFRASSVAENQQEVEFNIPFGITASLDEDLLIRLVENLLSNAVKYSPASGVIRVNLESDEPGPTIRIADNGPGIPEEQRDDIFQKFYKLDNGRGGQGLGLAFCLMVVEEHAGSIWVEENEPQGSVFCVSFPWQ